MSSRLGLTLASLLLSLTASVHGAAVYVASDSGQFGTLDLSTGAFQSIGTTADQLYGLVSTPAGYFSLTSSGVFVRINPGNATETILGDTGLGIKTNSIAAIGGTVYTIDTSGQLYTVNTANGALTKIGTPSANLPAIDPVNDDYFNSLTNINGTLYYTIENPTQGSTPKLFTINPATGAATLVGATSNSLDAALFTNNIYYAFTDVLNPQTRSIVSIDRTTGSSTLVTNIAQNLTSVYGAAAVPEPSTMALMGLGLAGALLARRRRQ